jgi:hypothetical protein
MKMFVPVHALPGDGFELKYCLRSTKMYAPQIDSVAIIGSHKPTWYFGEFIHHPHDPKLTGVANVITKLRRACDLVTGDFLWTNDDVYFLKPWKMEPVRHMSSSPMRKSIHDSGWRMAVELLKQAGIEKVRDFELHTPVIYNAPKMKALLDKVGTDKPLSIRTLYGNLYVEQSVPLMDVKSTEFLAPKPERPYYSSSDQSVTNQVFITWCNKMFPVIGDNEIERIKK